MFDDLTDALVRAPEPTGVPRLTRQAAALAGLLVLVLPFFLGGRLAGAREGVALLLYTLLLVHGARLLRGKVTESIEESNILRSLRWCGAMFLCAVLLQLLPLPAAVVGLISSHHALIQEIRGSSFGALSLDPALTINDLFWWLSLGIACLWLCRRPLAEDAEQGLHRDFLARRLLRSVAAAGLTAALVGLWHHAFDMSELFGVVPLARSEQRLHFPFSNPNHLAALLEMSAMLIASELLRRRRALLRDLPAEAQRNAARRRLVGLLLCLAVVMLALVLSLSRAGILLTGSGLLVLALLHLRGLPRRSAPHPVKDEKRADRARRLKRRILAGLKIAATGALAIAFFAYFLGAGGRRIFGERAEESMLQGIDSVRRSFAGVSLEIFADAPLFGIGLGCWHLAAQSRIARELGHWRLDYAHNEYLQLAAETGVGGTLPVLAALVLIVGFTMRRFRSGLTVSDQLTLAGCSLALLLPLVHALVDFHFHVPAFALAYMLTFAAQVRMLHLR